MVRRADLEGRLADRELRTEYVTSGSTASGSVAALQDTGISLYIHVPFCQTKCPYCDFNTYQGIEGLMSPFVEALAAEIGAWGRALDGPPVNTVFFGGGTPSYLPEGTWAGLWGQWTGPLGSGRMPR